jgi:hypothetical protein
MNALSLEIAGIRLSLTSALPLAPDPFPPEYRTFCANDVMPSRSDLSIRLVPEIPDVSGWGTLVTTANPWSLFRDGEVRRLVWRGNAPGTPRWLAEFIPNVPEVVVYCGSQLVVELEGGLSIRNPLHYPLDQLLMMYQFTRRGKGIVHSAGLVLDGHCIVAAGRSGAGKSTLSRCWAARHGVGTLLSDDRVILGGAPGSGGIPDACGSPWPGEMGVALNESHPVGALVFLAKARENRLEPISSGAAMERLLPVTSIPWFDTEYMTSALENVERWVAGVPAYMFHFTPDEGAVRMLETLHPF